MKKLSYLFIAIAVVLSDVMCGVVAYNYRDILCGGMHLGYSLPAEAAFLLAIPFVIGIAVCVVLAVVFRKKSK
ncbi:MAG: hypothetical protein J5874_05600 [Oscillospiraceae bacterium]|nr:hypothetical protein [Oscillospiraceae bacterium]